MKYGHRTPPIPLLPPTILFQFLFQLQPIRFQLARSDSFVTYGYKLVEFRSGELGKKDLTPSTSLPLYVCAVCVRKLEIRFFFLSRNSTIPYI